MLSVMKGRIESELAELFGGVVDCAWRITWPETNKVCVLSEDKVFKLRSTSESAYDLLTSTTHEAH